MPPSQDSPRHPDVYRESLLRYVAFTSDLGEACKPFISRRIYLGSYAIVAVYGLADTLDKGRRAYHRALEETSKQPAVLAAAPVRSQPAAPPAHLAASAAALRLASWAWPAPHGSLQAARACTGCLPPAAAYHASSASEGAVAAPVAAAVLDAALWHSAASLAIPAVAINRTVWAANRLLAGAWAASLPTRLRQLGPSAAGLALIPLLVPRVDEAVTEWMQEHLRPRLPQARQLLAGSSAGLPAAALRARGPQTLPPAWMQGALPGSPEEHGQ